MTERAEGLRLRGITKRVGCQVNNDAIHLDMVPGGLVGRVRAPAADGMVSEK